MRHRNLLTSILITAHIWSTDTTPANNHYRIATTQFGDPIIKVASECNKQTLTRLLEKHIQKGKSFFVDLPHHKGALASLIVQKGGAPFHTNTKRIRWIQRLDFDIPELLTCNSGAKVIITKKIQGITHVLFTKEHRYKHPIWPGGMLKLHEHIGDTLCREVKEELGITINKSDLTFLGVLHRIGYPKTYKKYGITHHHYLFHAPYNEKEPITPDGNEVVDILWIPLDQLIDGTAPVPLDEHKRIALKALKNRRGGACHELEQYGGLVHFCSV